MTRIFREIRAKLRSPCCLSEQPAMGNEVETLDYIPGTALRGMLAEAYLKRGNAADADFRRLFCDDLVCFPNLYHLGSTQCRPIPLSIYTCKSEPGFAKDKDPMTEAESHGAWDLLFEQEDSERRCSSDQANACGRAPLKPHTGFYNGGLTSENVKRRIITRTAIDYRTQSALEASLHSQSELPAGMEFWGLLTASDEAVFQKLSSILPSVGYTGRRRMGKVEITIWDHPLTPKATFLDFSSESGALFFALTLHSDAILVDRYLRPVITLTPDILKDPQQVGFPDVEVKFIKAFCATRRVSGWHSVARIFKPDDIALVKGSTFLMKVQETAKSAVESWMERVICTGIGLRRSEGFGQVCFDEPLHQLAAREKGGPL